MPNRPDDQPNDPEPAARKTLGKPEQLPHLVSDQDVEDADDMLFAHPPRVVRRWVCGCGADYPCTDVLFARLVKATAEAGE
ncbi:hypothetical protein C7C45_13645 [Micromonospora arborensis]|uniref:Uncharacterized protein n=1 Tax=Micromonospora arborensis TaxID=2116518 RepID=A0A318P2P6_9ACTN|nr:hypothetical protein [Micromonospora arborensis]PYC70418.1 hypothetical protein C7C45_13645 [Micromonospora arborensis]